MDKKRGRCLCGAVTFEYSGDENWRAHCHCESCRRQTSSPFTTFMGVPDGAWRFTGETPKAYVSSPGVRRLFCARCGSPIAYDADAFPGRSTSTPRASTTRRRSSPSATCTPASSFRGFT